MGIPLLPQIVFFNDDSYEDDSEMNSLQFLKRFAISQELLKNTAPYAIFYKPILEKLFQSGEITLIICPL